MHNGIKCVVLGVEYPSIPAAWRAHMPDGVSCHLAQARVQMGWDVERAVLTPVRGKRVVVRGTKYRSIVEAWRAHSPDGLLYCTVLNRIDRGWEPERAVLVRPDWNSLYMRRKHA